MSAIADDDADELAFWLEIIEQAERLHDGFGLSMREEVELGYSERELMKMATHFAGMSTPTRRRVERLVRKLHRMVSQHEAPAEPPLRVVGGAGGW